MGKTRAHEFNIRRAERSVSIGIYVRESFNFNRICMPWRDARAGRRGDRVYIEMTRRSDFSMNVFLLAVGEVGIRREEK